MTSPVRAYRPDIDGLRAVSVLSIFLFHIDPRWMPGGFIGVDIFFVISGFLIGNIVMQELREGRFSLLTFYERRFRRILPALFAMLAVVTAAGAFLLFPILYIDFAKSMAAATFSVSNLYFWATTKYFGLDAHSKPLLHTWSLGVEEQFYILFPLGLYLLHRFLPRHLISVVMLVLVASLGLSIAAVTKWPSATFYLLPTRAWELLLGFAMGLGAISALRSSGIREAVAAVGACAIAIALIFYSPETLFPGLTALLPCAGAAAIIAAGRAGPTWVGRALSIAPMTGIGLISYSVYLWHWPLIVLLRETVPIDHFTVAQGLGVLMAGLALGYISWRLVEQPFRSRRIGRRAIFVGSAAGAALIAAASLVIVAGAGMPGRFRPDVARMASYIDYSGHTEYPHGTCFLDDYEYERMGSDPCLRLDRQRPNVALFGDSHAEHLWFGLQTVQPDINYVQTTLSGCRPRIEPLPGDLPRCTEGREAILSYLTRQPLDLVVIAGDWDAHDRPRVARIIRMLRNSSQRVLLIGPIPRYATSAAKLIALSLMRNDPMLPSRFIKPESAMLDASYAALAREQGIPYVSARQILCRADCRRLDPNGVPLQYDEAHLTDEGSLLFAAHLAPVVDRLILRPAP